MANKKAEAKTVASKAEKATSNPGENKTKTSTRRCGTRKKAAKEAIKVGSKFECAACGLIVTVDTPCNCAETQLICCGSPMDVKK
ncbi:MAG: hypothetical protein N2745_02465 [Syntrophorhabdaceae bacterium]|nr:hypothetical protein [Syntrophorhabdaceae bacterium]